MRSRVRRHQPMAAMADGLSDLCGRVVPDGRKLDVDGTRMTLLDLLTQRFRVTTLPELEAILDDYAFCSVLPPDLLDKLKQELTPMTATWEPVAGGPAVHVILCSIVDMVVDMIACPTNGSMKGGGGVSGIIAGKDKKAGGQIAELCAQYVRMNGELREGQVFCSSGFDNIAYVVFAVGPSCHGQLTPANETSLRVVIRAILTEAHKRDVIAIAIPAISTGVAGFPKDRAAYIFMEEFARFCQWLGTQKRSTLKNIYLVDIDQETTEIFGDEMRLWINSSAGTAVKVKKSHYEQIIPLHLREKAPAPAPAAAAPRRAVKVDNIEPKQPVYDVLGPRPAGTPGGSSDHVYGKFGRTLPLQGLPLASSSSDDDYSHFTSHFAPPPPVSQAGYDHVSPSIQEQQQKRRSQLGPQDDYMECAPQEDPHVPHPARPRPQQRPHYEEPREFRVNAPKPAKPPPTKGKQ